MIVPIKQPGRSITKDRADALDSVLSFLFLSENKERWDWIAPYCEDSRMVKAIESFNHLNLSHFDGADTSWLYESLGSEARRFFNWQDRDMVKEFARLPGHWDSKLIAFFAEAASQHPEIQAPYLFSLSRFRTVPLKDVRGLFTLRASTVVEKSYAHLFNNGSYVSSREYLQYFGGAWHCVGIPFGLEQPMRMEDDAEVWSARSMALTAEYDWTVNVGFNVKHIPTVSLPSDPISSREVFKLRDVPAGKSRRDALKHWVRGHTRKSVAADYPEKYIWPYLRGAEEFTWNGLYCKIQPSAYDLRKAMEYQAMRKKGLLA